MSLRVPLRIALVGFLILGSSRAAAPPDGVRPLPDGVKAVWTAERAYRESTVTRERLCTNGLWHWQPVDPESEGVPQGRWGWFKVPGPWPGITDYMQKDCQTVYSHPAWSDIRLAEVRAAWYEREVEVPAGWAGRRITLQVAYLNSFATVYLDRKRVGELEFPGGALDITGACQPGSRHTLSLRIEAFPLEAVLLSYSDSNAAREVRGSVARRGLCGDVHLVAEPCGARLEDVTVSTSVRRWTITVGASLRNLRAGARYVLEARIRDGARTVGELASPPFTATELQDGRISFTEGWQPRKLWDTHTPENTYKLDLALLEPGGTLLDAAHPVRFGFRELWIDGRDFYLNGTRIFLSTVPLDNAQVGAALATYEAARESLLRLRSFGIDLVYTHNYD
jgi:beta-galactosidase/beta-glucuronidase